MYYTIIGIIILISFLYSSNVLLKHNKIFIKQFNDYIDVKRLVELEEFTSNLRLDPLTDEVELTNQYDCTTNKPRICEVNNNTSCFGCKSLVAKCVHLDKDTKYVHEGVVDVLKKNENPNEGYCLSLKQLTEACNPYHGDLVLVSINKVDSAYICMCRNPGYIGNMNILGACDTPFICNGNVENINVQFNELKCNCVAGFTSKTINNIPICKMQTVYETRYENIPQAIDKFVYDKTIANNFNGDYIKNPCEYCPVTNLYVGGYPIKTTDGYKCVANESGFGVPIRRNKLFRLLEGNSGADAVLALRYHTVNLYGNMGDAGPGAVVLAHKHENVQLCNKLNYDKDNIVISTNRMDTQFPFSKIKINTVPWFVCEGHWPSYSCFLKIGNESGCQRFDQSGSSLIKCSGRTPPLSFPWNTENWINFSNFNYTLNTFNVDDEWFTLQIGATFYKENEAAMSLRLIGLQYKFNNSTNVDVSVIRSDTRSDWFKFREKLIEL